MMHAVNWLSIVIAAAAAWLFGGVYYSALSKYWMAAQGKTLEDCKAEQAAKSSAAKFAPFVVVFVSEIIMAWATYGVLVHLNTFTLRAGLISGAALWFGYILTTVASNYAFHGKKPTLILIDSLAWLGAMLIIGGIVGWMGR